MSKIRLTPLGGLYEFGNQSYLYRLDDTAVLVDAGAFSEGSRLDSEETRFLPNYDFLNHIGRLDAILITHNHEDHFGGLTYLLKKFPRTPVYCSPFVSDNISMRSRVEGFEIPNFARRIHSVTEYRMIKIRDNFQVEFLPTDHSVPQASMIYITTPCGNVLHTGDWRYDKSSHNLNWNRLRKIGKDGLTALVADSTGINNTRNDLYSESQIYDGLEDVILRNKGKYKNFIFSTFSTHAERIASICDLSRAYTHKDAQFLGTSMIVNQLIAAQKAMLNVESVKLARDVMPNQGFYIATGSQAEEGSFLMNLAQGKRFAPDSTCIVMSASEIPSRKNKIHQMITRLRSMGYKVIQNDEENITHMSGHATCSDMELLIRATKPEIYVPVHGEGHHLIDAEELANQLNTRNVHRFNSVGETLFFAKRSDPVCYRDFKYRRLEVTKNFDPKFVQKLKQWCR